MLTATPATAATRTLEEGGFSTPAHPGFSDACGYDVALGEDGELTLAFEAHEGEDMALVCEGLDLL